MLLIFGGLPASGKSTISIEVATTLSAMHLRIDTIEQELRASGFQDIGPTGYTLAYRIAADNLKLGMIVVADSVNPISLSRDAWRDVGESAGVHVIEIEIVCSDLAEHKERVEQRRADIEGLVLPTWKEVQDREYQEWSRHRIVIDTSGETPARSIERTLAAIDASLPT